MHALSAGCHLSASRLRHVFLESVGVPLARYRWWLRLRRVALAIQQGRDLTGAAYDAGFSDSAHLSRIFRRTFGFPPSLLMATTHIAIVERRKP
jgi:AraC-like DNA-binding protein